MLESIEKHPTLNSVNSQKYQREEAQIGYCFGRAMYYHLVLLKMGVPKNFIRKIWIVGPIATRSDNKLIWGFHVATVVYTKDRGWVTIDTNEVKPEPVKDWYASNSSRSIDKKARIYVTNASKFGVSIETYNKVQLGIKSEEGSLGIKPNENDWYKGYFFDLLTSMRKISLEDR